jgi:hypothetical protein
MPWIGPAREEWQIAICGFSPSPEALHCDRDATWHGIRFDGEDLIAMSCCDEHLPIAKALCEYVHAHVHPCGIPGSMFRWPENECYTDWDEQAEFTQAQLMAGAV